MSRYVVVYELDESGAWIVRVPGVRGCHSYGRSIAEARRHIREALSLFVRGTARAELIDDVRLPRGAARALRAVRSARERADRARARAARSLSRVAAVLTGRLGLSVRDAGELLGVSHQRVQQLVGRAA